MVVKYTIHWRCLRCGQASSCIPGPRSVLLTPWNARELTLITMICVNFPAGNFTSMENCRCVECLSTNTSWLSIAIAAMVNYWMVELQLYIWVNYGISSISLLKNFGDVGIVTATNHHPDLRSSISKSHSLNWRNTQSFTQPWFLRVLQCQGASFTY